MSLVGDAARAAGAAGKNFLGYFVDANNLKNVAQTAALKTAMQTGVSQVVPMALGVPAPPIGETLVQSGLTNLIGTPIGGSLEAAGLPRIASNVIGDVGGTIATAHLLRNVNPEGKQARQRQEQPGISPELAEYMLRQRFDVGLEQQRYNNQINLAAARNYSPPTRIIHSNPSADFQTAASILNPRTSYT